MPTVSKRARYRVGRPHGGMIDEGHVSEDGSTVIPGFGLPRPAVKQVQRFRVQGHRRRSAYQQNPERGHHPFRREQRRHYESFRSMEAPF